MTLDDIYEALSTGELSQVILGADIDGVQGIPEAKRKQIRHSVQMGLSDLHGRFLIREKWFTVNLVEGKSIYVLASKYAESNTASTDTKFIDDTADPFQDDLLKIERVYDALGKPVALNEIDNDKSVMTMAENILLVPADLGTDSLDIVFRANHPTLNKYIADAAPFTVQIALPVKYMHALLLFVASRVHNPIGFNETMHEGNNYLQKYEMECQRLAAQGAGIDTATQNTKLVNNGWV